MPVQQHKSEQAQKDLVLQWNAAMQNVGIIDNTDTISNDNQEASLLENMIGVISIDKIDFEMPVLKGSSINNLKVAAATIEPTNTPKDGGNFCLAIHNSLRKGKYLNRVMELTIGDIIVYESSSNNKYEYKITELLYVDPTDTTVLEQADENIITLVTCYPADTAEQRYIVRGVLL